MKKALLLAGLYASATWAGTVEDLALKIAVIDCGSPQGWVSMLAVYEKGFTQAEKDNQDLTRGAYLADRLGEAARRFESEPTIGALKAVVFLIALHSAWDEVVPDNWRSELEKFTESATKYAESNTIDWPSMLKSVRATLSSTENGKYKKK